MVGFGGGAHLLWRAVNIDCCRLDVVSRALQERQLTVTVAVTVAVHFLSACYTETVSPVFRDGSTVPQCLYMRECVFAFICLFVVACVYIYIKGFMITPVVFPFKCRFAQICPMHSIHVFALYMQYIYVHE